MEILKNILFFIGIIWSFELIFIALWYIRLKVNEVASEENSFNKAE